MDNHHVAGDANRPVTIPVPENDHRAELSTAQYDWRREMLENPDGNPLLKIAARIQGFLDTLFYLMQKLLFAIPEALVLLNQILTDKVGQQWWMGTPLEKFI
jgi:hypothetical protein